MAARDCPVGKKKKKCARGPPVCSLSSSLDVPTTLANNVKEIQGLERKKKKEKPKKQTRTHMNQDLEIG
jgi:hypothetical protein